jgi:hypothetical protein
MTLDFWGILLLAIYAGLALLVCRLTGWMARGAERVSAFLRQAHPHTRVKRLRVILIGHDQQTYVTSRCIVWNGTHVQFAVLWAGCQLVGGLLWVLKQ